MLDLQEDQGGDLSGYEVLVMAEFLQICLGGLSTRDREMLLAKMSDERCSVNRHLAVARRRPTWQSEPT